MIFSYNRNRMTKQEKDALDPIIQNLKEIGIEVHVTEQNDQTIKFIKSNPQKWDILYDEIEIQLKDSASEYFMTFNGENINYHKYSNSKLDELFNICRGFITSFKVEVKQKRCIVTLIIALTYDLKILPNAICLSIL